MHHFLDAGPEYGAKVDFRSRRLYGIGHSLGGNAMAMLQTIEPRIHFASLSIVDPMLSPAGSHHLNKLRSILIKGAYERRDVWPDRTMAMQALKRRERTKKWDARILDIFIVSRVNHIHVRICLILVETRYTPSSRILLPREPIPGRNIGLYAGSRSSTTLYLLPSYPLAHLPLS